MSITVKIPEYSDLFVKAHEQLPYWTEDIVLLWGGRFGAKSESVARWLVLKCIKQSYFRCVLARKVKDTVKDSQYQQIKDFVTGYGLQDLFIFRKAPLEIECINGNKFICRGFDRSEKIKGIKDPSDFWIEEGAEIEQEDFETALTTLRTNKVKPQLYMTFNPEVSTPLNEYWLHNRFFKEQAEKIFVTDLSIKQDKKSLKFSVRSCHTTYKDNQFVNDNQIAIVENYRVLYEQTKSQVAEYYYKVWTLGQWGNRLPENPYLSSFSEIKHIKHLELDITKQVHVSFDMNVNPYLPCGIYQGTNQIHEIALLHPDNRTHKIALEVVKYLKKHNYTGHVSIYGDSTARKDDTNQEVGTNFFTIIRAEMSKYFKVYMCVPGMRSNKRQDFKRPFKNPNSMLAGDFLNDLLDKQQISVNANCKKSINDYINAPRANDGGIDKKEKDSKTGGQKWGHLTDCLKYYICEAYYDDFMSYCNKVSKRGI